MHFKLLIAFVNADKTNDVLDRARKSGATGATVITQARGEGIERPRSFFGVTLDTSRDILLFIVEEHMSRIILEAIADVGDFDKEGGGLAIQIDVEDAVGITPQIKKLTTVVEEEI